VRAWWEREKERWSTPESKVKEKLHGEFFEEVDFCNTIIFLFNFTNKKNSTIQPQEDEEEISIFHVESK
jgi:hypothetical protein